MKVTTRFALAGFVSVAMTLAIASPTFAAKPPPPAEPIDGARIINGTVTGAKVAGDSLTGGQINESTLVGVDADTLDGIDSSELSFSRTWGFKYNLCGSSFCNFDWGEGYPDLEQEADYFEEGVLIENEAWPFGIRLTCFDLGPGPQAKIVVENATDATGPATVAKFWDADGTTFTRVSMLLYVDGPTIIVNGTPTATRARIEVGGTVNIGLNCKYFGTVQIDPAV